jgi:hypothetical protein
MDRAEALRPLPDTDALELRRDEGMQPDAMTRVLDVEPKALGTLLTLAESKLAGLLEPE